MVRELYKPTEAGLIPESWTCTKLQDVISVLTDYTANGSFASLAENVEYLEKYDYARLVRLTDIRANFKNDGIYVTKSSYEFLKKSKLFGNELLLANVGAYAGYSFVFQNPDGFKATLGPNMFLIKLDRKFIDDSYENLIFSGDLVFRQLLDKAASSAQPKLNKDNVRECYCAIPPLPEQKKISKVLSDVDELITSLEKLISKKTNIKIGMIQELMSGKCRLEGFNDEWITITLGEAAEIKDGTHQTPHYTESGIPFYSVENVTNDEFKNTKHISLTEHYQLTSAYKIEKGDVLMTRIGTLGICKYVDWEVDASFYVSLALIKCKEILNAEFLCALAETADFRKEIEINSLQYAVPMKINLSKISDIKIKIPKNIKEQKALADVIGDINKDIRKLSQCLYKYRQIKQGMMNELLTGKIRLV